MQSYQLRETSKPKFSPKIRTYQSRQTKSQDPIIATEVNKGFRKIADELQVKVDLAHDRIATLESCYMNLYHENQELKNKQKACNIIIKGVPEKPRMKMYETMGDLFATIGGNANYLMTDGAVKARDATDKPRPIQVFCKSLLPKGEIFRSLEKIKANPNFANVRLSSGLNGDEMMQYKEVLHTAATNAQRNIQNEREKDRN